MLDVTNAEEGYIEFGEYQTWYRITGDLASGKVPVIIAHGGPGCTHDYVDSYKALADHGHAVIHYDQIGNGRSTHLPDAPKDFWNIDLFLDELEALKAQLGIADNYALLGQSWGGMLASEHGVRRPKGLKALIIANSPSSMKTWVEEALRLRKALPDGIHETLLRYEETEDYSNPEYLAATDVFYRNHVCRMAEWPEEVKRTFAALEEDPTVYHTMNGPTEFHVIGTMKAWTVEDRLHLVEAPTLVLTGLYDEATPRAAKAYAEYIPGAEWIILGKSSHMPHVEELELCMGVVSNFLSRKI